MLPGVNKRPLGSSSTSRNVVPRTENMGSPSLHFSGADSGTLSEVDESHSGSSLFINEQNTELSTVVPGTNLVLYSKNEKVTTIINAFQARNYGEIKTILTTIVEDKTRLVIEDKKLLLGIVLTQLSEELFTVFLKLGKFDEEIKKIDMKDGSLIHLAASRNYCNCIESMLNLGIAFNERNSDNETPLYTAIRYGRLEFVQSYICKYENSVIRTDINIEKYNKQFNPLSYAVLWNQPEIVSFLLDRYEVEIGDKLEDVLKLVVEFERYTILTILLEHKKVLDTHNTNSRLIARAFAHAAFLSRSQMLKNLACQFRGVAQNIIHRDCLPIHSAIDSVNSEPEVLKTIRCLLKLGVDIAQRDQHGCDAFTYAGKLLKEAEDRKDEKNAGKYKAIRNVLESKIEAVWANQYKLLHCKIKNVEALVFSGGGPKGVAYIGVLEQLASLMSKEATHFNNILRIAGTSSGAMTAGLLAVGYTPQELRYELLQQSILDFVDNNVVQSLMKSSGKNRFQLFVDQFTQYCRGNVTWKDYVKAFTELKQETHGLCTGEKLLNWIEERIHRKIKEVTGQDIPYLTFGELKELKIRYPTKLKDLYVVTTNFSGSEPEIRVFSSEDESSKNNIISYTIRASVSIPGLFSIAHEYIKHSGKPQAIEGTYYVDGGLIRNRPIDIFDKSKYIKAGLSFEKQDYPVYNERVIGFVLDEDVVENTAQNTTFTTQDYLSRLASTYYNAERILSNTKANNNRIIAVNCGKVNMLSFNLTDQEKSTLINAGAEAVRDFFPQGPQ